MNNSFNFLPSVVVHVCLNVMLVYMRSAYHCLPLVACSLINSSDVNSAFMENPSWYEKLPPCEKLKLSESDFWKPWGVACRIQIVTVLAKRPPSFCCTLKLFPPTPVLQLHLVASLWFYEWNVMICICIKVFSLDASSVLKTFMGVNLGKKFFAIHDIFLPLCFSCPRFMWIDYT